MKNYDLFSTLVIRTPLLSTKTILSENDDTILHAFNEPAVQEALMLASPALYAEFLKWTRNEIGEPGDVRRLKNTLLKYLSRMSFRCTPFGIFAGFSMVKWGNNSAMTLADRLNKNIRLDMYYLCTLGSDLSRHTDIKDQLRFFTNNTVYKFGNECRYIETQYLGNNRKYNISSVEHSEYLDRVLKTAESGSTLKQLTQSLLDSDISEDEASSYVNLLAENQLLVSELEPPLIGHDALGEMTRVLEGIEVKTGFVTNVIDRLQKTQSLLRELEQNTSNSSDAYKKISDQLEQIGTSIDHKFLVQVDLRRPMTHASADQRLAGHVRKAIQFLKAINQDSTLPNLEAFRNAFIERYESREIPLQLALDNESGIGYPPLSTRGDISPLVDDIFTPGPENNDFSIGNGDKIRFLQRKWMNAIATGAYEVDFANDAVTDTINRELADTFSVIGSFLSSGENAQILIKLVAGLPSAAALLGRFTNSDPDLLKFCEEITSLEQHHRPDAILAEVVHLPQSRNGNVISREKLRQYEIPFISRSLLDRDHQVRLEDLLISVTRSGRVVLRSKRLNKEIIPRMATAHNFSHNALPIYHFLCDLQFQDSRGGLQFNWGGSGIQYPFQPRARLGNVILARASWSFSKGDLKLFKNLKSPTFDADFNDWRLMWKIPDQIYLIDDDNELFMDLSRPPFRELFISEIKDRDRVLLTEYLFSGKSAVNDEAGSEYTNEFVMSFGRKLNDKKGTLMMSGPLSTEINRKFIHGSEWLYYKLYMGPATADLVLTNPIRQLIEDLKRANWIDDWFFIRYADPHHHVRLRLHLADQSYLGQVSTAVYSMLQPLSHEGLISKVQTDTYEREVERYGASSMSMVEKMFTYQSEQALLFLTACEGASDQELLRYLLLIHEISSLISNFYQDPSGKKLFLDAAVEGYEKEFKANSITFQQLGVKYKLNSKVLEQLFANSTELSPEWNLLKQAVEKYDVLITATIDNIKSTSPEQVNGELLWNLCHMLTNRVARSNARKHELILFSDLRRYNATQLAKGKAKTIT